MIREEDMATTHDPLAPASTTTDFQDSHTTSSGLKAKVSEATSHVKHTAADFGRSAADNINRNLKNAAGALENTASKLRRPESEGKVASLANTTADKLDSTARYFRDHDTQDMLRGAESWARRNPGAAIGSAAALGFVLGLSMTRDRRRY
jgi:ElaB/YqjD/DUF883 family membrane-anchored ribosome-binding protein